MIVYYVEYRSVNPDRAGPAPVARDRLSGATTDKEANVLFVRWLAAHKEALDKEYFLPPIRLLKVIRSEKCLRRIGHKEKK